MPSSFKRASKDHKRGHSSANSYLLKRKYHSICQRLRYAKKTVHACSSVLTGSLVTRYITPFFTRALTRYSTSCELGWRIAVHHRAQGIFSPVLGSRVSLGGRYFFPCPIRT